MFKNLGSKPHGLNSSDVINKTELYGVNKLPTRKNTTFLTIILKQFLNPLIYVLLIAAVISIFLGHISDAGFIIFVLLLNAIIGAVQEFKAEKNALSLQTIVPTIALVERDNQLYEVNTEELVPGDIIFLQSGNKVPADIRLIETHTLIIDESLLTGESIPVTKNSDLVLTAETPVGDRVNMAFAGTMITSGRGRGVVSSIGLKTELGKIAKDLQKPNSKTPLIIRMETFTKKISALVVLIVITMGTIFYLQGNPLVDVLLLSVAIAVASIPEGLPVAITIALSIASKRMSKRNVIVKNLPAVEALGSCNYIASDKTGTLTVNELTVKALQIPRQQAWEVTGAGFTPVGCIIKPTRLEDKIFNPLTHSLVLHSVLCNDAYLNKKNESWSGIGDAVDIALIVLGQKINLNKLDLKDSYKRIAEIPYESENQSHVTVHEYENKGIISVKGSVEKVLSMSSHMQTNLGAVSLDAEHITKQSNELSQMGYKVIAIASGDADSSLAHNLTHTDLKNMTFLGLIGIIDPLRNESKKAVKLCQDAGVKVAMITGDHPITSYVIGKQLGLIENTDEVITGQHFKKTEGNREFDTLVNKAHIFSRVEPSQKLQIVESLMRNGSFVAMTGDGANDSPALKRANVGVAMGKSGTDVARESADLILIDDNFASIVAGIEEGRVAYSNIRKVIYLLISTGAAEVLIFVFSTLLGLPMPLTAVQVLWMNLVTNGIQDVALAFEESEGDELTKPPRPQKEPIFDKVMIKRVITTALVMSVVSILVFKYYLDLGRSTFEARNTVLLLMVLFENVMIGNCRSETKSAFSISPFKNKFLLLGVLGAQLLHIVAMHVPFLANILSIKPVSIEEWGLLLLLSLTVLIIVEIDKLITRMKINKTQVKVGSEY
ncbi:MAG: HAD-IC family P-type ATPase [Bdellovibrionaceae bacterium]|nr:HAD-IC family P-type ATPase [Pseudobdellovibrionaceae bacterium]